MAKRKTGNKKAKQAGNGENGGIVSLTKELFQAAITLRGSVEPADYKRYVLPIIFLRFLSLRYDRRCSKHWSQTRAATTTATREAASRSVCLGQHRGMKPTQRRCSA